MQPPIYRIIATSNHNEVTVNDKLIADNITNHEEAVVMTDALNKTYSDDTATYWYTVVPETYTLHVYNPNE